MKPPRPLRRGPAAAPLFSIAKRGHAIAWAMAERARAPRFPPAKKEPSLPGRLPTGWDGPYSSAFPARMFL